MPIPAPPKPPHCVTAVTTKDPEPVLTQAQWDAVAPDDEEDRA